MQTNSLFQPVIRPGFSQRHGLVPLTGLRPATCRHAARPAHCCSSQPAQVAQRKQQFGVSKPQRGSVLCRSDATSGQTVGQAMTLVNLISALAKASNAWDKYDKDRNGTLCLEECEEIFNSAEICEAVEMVTNMSCKVYTSADLEPFFKRADGDKSGTLSRSEFLALYLAVATDRVKKNPLLLAEALLGFIDTDKNGVLEGGEIKALLTILGFAPILLMPIPSFIKLEYKSILKQLGGGR